MSLPFDPSECGMKVGIEVHQQLAAATKLFCSCPVVKSAELPLSFERRLRPSQSELGKIDPAAVFEFNKGKVNRYMWSPESSCLVEADEEPPHPMNVNALETTLLISLMLGAKVVEEIHVMRKIVIDGSNTSGFQRTAVVGLGGRLNFDGKSVGVQSLTVEEDSSRVLGEDSECRRFGLDRLGVPLVEIALDPMVGYPEDVESAALQLGRALRSTGRVARGLGTIRQDLNVSVMGGEVVEVKGVQKLNLIAKVVRYEGLRQMGLIRIAEEMRARGIVSVNCRTTDVTSVFSSSASPVLRNITRSGGRVLCVTAEGLAGLMGHEPFPGIRLGKELAEIARTNSLGGIIHSDEFRKQKISENEESELRKLAGSSDKDALILIAGPEDRTAVVSELVAERLGAVQKGVPKETRAATDDGETRYLRPRPGAARMYPETDIPEIVITEEWLAELAKKLPVPWEERVRSYVDRYSLSPELSLQLYDSGDAPVFEKLASELSLDRSVIASVLVEMPARLVREGVDESKLSDDLLADLLRSMDRGDFAKEAAINVLRSVCRGEAESVQAAVKNLGLTGLGEDELRTIIDQVVEKNRAIVSEKGERSFSVLMGEVMKVARGRADGQLVSKLLRERISSSRDDAQS
jgi:glutamyl-tRNA(Gln) amidotransferase subunit E